MFFLGEATTSGWSAGGFASGCYTITIVDQSFVIFPRQHREFKRYNGIVWCVSVDNQSVVVRRNGFIFITGNSHGKLLPIGKQHDVGVDHNNFYPVSFDKIKEIMKNQPDNPGLIKK